MDYQDGVLRIGILGAEGASPKTMEMIVSNPSTMCQLVAIVTSTSTTPSQHLPMEQFKNNLMIPSTFQSKEKSTEEAEEEDISDGVSIMDSFEKIIQSEHIDAVFIAVQQRIRKEWTIKALRAGKHVLLELPAANSYTEYTEMMKEAKIAKRYLQDTTMFVHHHRIQEFLDCVMSDHFGKIKKVGAFFSVMGENVVFDSHLWEGRNDFASGCIGCLGWFCVRLGLMIFHSAGCKAILTARVEHVILNENGSPIDAICKLLCGQGIEFTFHCSFIQRTRQKVEVIGEHEKADMIDFFSPHHVFTSFQLHREATNDADDQITSVIDTIDCEAGPPQDVTMWRTFSKLARDIGDWGEKNKDNGIYWTNDHKNHGKAIDLSEMSVEAQKVIDALMESISKGGAEITLT